MLGVILYPLLLAFIILWTIVLLPIIIPAGLLSDKNLKRKIQKNLVNCGKYCLLYYYQDSKIKDYIERDLQNKFGVNLVLVRLPEVKVDDGKFQDVANHLYASMIDPDCLCDIPDELSTSEAVGSVLITISPSCKPQSHWPLSRVSEGDKPESVAVAKKEYESKIKGCIENFASHGHTSFAKG